MPKTAHWILCLLLPTACLFAACGGGGGADGDLDGDMDGDTEGDLPPVIDPSGPGLFNVGAVAFVTSYTDPDVAGRVRELPCVAWYPTREVEGDPFYYQTFLKRPQVFREALPARADGPFPLVAFSHGNSGVAEQSWTHMEHLARHGFVSASCDHVGNTAADFEEETVPQSIHDRPYDVRAMTDRMVALSADAGHLLAGTVDQGRIAASGHSLGAFTSLMVAGAHLDFPHTRELCAANPDAPRCDLINGNDTSMIVSAEASDPRVKAGIAFAPAGYPFFNGDVGLAFVPVPMLVLGGDRDGTCTMQGEVGPIYRALAVPKALVTISGAGHMSFTEMCGLVGGVDDYLIKEGCAPDFTPPEDVFKVMNRYAVAFLRRFLDGDLRYDEFLTPGDPGTAGLPAEIETEMASR